VNNQSELDLLLDLAKLIKKYGPEPFESLAKSITTSDLQKRLTDLLSISSNIAKTTHVGSKKTTKRESANSLQNTLSVLKQTSPQKHELILNFYNAFQQKTILPTMRDVNYFIQDCGLPEIKGSTRQKAIGPLIKRLILLPTDQLSKHLNFPKTGTSGDRSLEGWTNIILNKNR
jgi:hypothetical protein